MAQVNVTSIEKAAVLLSGLAPQALDTVMQMLGPEFSGRLRKTMTAVARRKDLAQLRVQVLQEFHEVQQEVRAATHPIQESPGRATAATDKGPAGSPKATASDAESSNPLADAAAGADSLAEMPPAILGAALKSESPRIIATVLKQLPSDISGKVLEILPPEIRQSAFLLMADTQQVNPVVISRVLERLLVSCRNVNPADAQQEDRRVKTLIGVLQTVEREERLRLLEILNQRDPELASQIDNLMYDYLDLLRIEDRSVQKLLGQLEQRVVATALKSASEELRQKVFKNLSERVRLALNEEMELLSGLNNSKIDQARKEIANVIRTHDKDGSLMWME